MSNTSIEEIVAGAVNVPTHQELAACLSGAYGGNQSLREDETV